jgi:hypothetical protein
LFARTPQATSPSANQNVDAAFRDGVYQASLDVENARKPHLGSGRWSANADRAMFIAGYEQAYQDAARTSEGKAPQADAAEVAGYLDGMADGATDGGSSHAFRCDRTANYLSARQAFAQSSEDGAKFQQEYRNAYVNGYQQGYYANQNASSWSYYSR